MRPGAALWRVLAEGADLLDTAPGWAARLGVDHGALGTILVGTTRRALHWPCGLGRDSCWRRLVPEGDGFTAVCADEDWSCQPESVRPADSWLYRLDEGGIVSAVRAGLALAGAAQRRLLPGTWWVGGRDFGEVSVGFYLTTDTDRPALDAVTADADAGEKELVVLLAAAEPDRPVAALAEDRGIDVRPLGAIAELHEGGSLTFDLCDLVLRHRFRGLEDPSPLLTDRIRLLLHPLGGTVWLDRAPLPLSKGKKLPWALLGALADRPGRDVLRKELLPAVFPEYGEHNKGQRWHERLRQARDELPEAPWPISAVPGGFEDGGYRLDLFREEIAWWSDRPEARPAKPDQRGKRKAIRPRK